MNICKTCNGKGYLNSFDNNLYFRFPCYACNGLGNEINKDSEVLKEIKSNIEAFIQALNEITKNPYQLVTKDVADCFFEDEIVKDQDHKNN